MQTSTVGSPRLSCSAYESLAERLSFARSIMSRFSGVQVYGRAFIATVEGKVCICPGGAAVVLPIVSKLTKFIKREIRIKLK